MARPENATTKVRIVFDGSAQRNGKSLDSELLPGPKLQSGIGDMLVKLRKESFTLLGDVTQMYHQFSDQLTGHCTDFCVGTWAVMIPPGCTNFKGFIFGECYCPFCVQFVG